MLKVTYCMNSGNEYTSFFEGDSWKDVADFISDSTIINIDEDEEQIQLMVNNISEFVVERVWWQRR